MGRIERITVTIPYTPRGQFRDFHNRSERWACIVAHRRAGKTVACINELIKAALLCRKPEPRFAYVAPFYAQAKDVAWAYLKRFAAPIPGVETNESELRVDFPNGGRVRLYGADNYDRLRGLYLDGVVLDEPADMDPRAWPEVIRPALADRQGWATFIGTPKGRNGFWEIWERAGGDPSWYRAMLRASETGLVAQSELDDLRKALTPEQYEQELECSFEAAILGAYYGKEIADAERAGRVTDVPYDPALQVYTSWDLGIGDSTAIWFFQVAHDGVRWIDHYENHGQPLGHYASVLAAKPYAYADDWVPHDAKVRELGTGRTRVETLKELGRKPKLVPDHRIEDGINAARIGFPRFWFDQTKCKLALEALRQYRTDYDEKLKVFKNTPKHDWTSHAADAFRYGAMAWRELVPHVEKPQPQTDMIFTALPDGRVVSNMSVRERVEQIRRKRLNG
jgi:phage terminase large subunit